MLHLGVRLLLLPEGFLAAGIAGCLALPCTFDLASLRLYCYCAAVWHCHVCLTWLRYLCIVIARGRTCVLLFACVVLVLWPALLHTYAVVRFD
jgi:hypothetical protein